MVSPKGLGVGKPVVWVWRGSCCCPWGKMLTEDREALGRRNGPTALLVWGQGVGLPSPDLLGLRSLMLCHVWQVGEAISFLVRCKTLILYPALLSVLR